MTKLLMDGGLVSWGMMTLLSAIQVVILGMEMWEGVILETFGLSEW